MPKSNSRECGFNRIRRSQVSPVFGREVVEREQHVPVLGEARTSRWVFRLVLLKEVVERFLGVFS